MGNHLRPIRPAYAQWLCSRLATLKEFHRDGRVADIRALAANLTESAAAMGYEEVEAAAQAVFRLADNDRLDSAIEILRRIVNRAVWRMRRDAA